MANLNVSAAHSLQLVPINRLFKFGQAGTAAKIQLLSKPDEGEAIPGTIAISTSEDSGIIHKTITYKRRIVDHTTADLLEGYKATRLIAIYVDETGHRRVAGSPTYPLKFSFTSGEGVFTCKLEGEATTIDPFIL